MFVIGLICILICFITSFILLIDMFRKKTAIGCLGMLLFPIMPFIWVLKWYSGNRKIVAPILYISAILGISIMTIQWRTASEDLKVFIDTAKDRVALECTLHSIKIEEEGYLYTLFAAPTGNVEISYSDVKDMVQQYQKQYIDPLLPDFSNLYPEEHQGNIVIAIKTPSGFYACYRIEHPGKVVKRWSSSKEAL